MYFLSPHGANCFAFSEPYSGSSPGSVARDSFSALIPLRDVETIKSKRPDCDIHVYHGGHGFACDERARCAKKRGACMGAKQQMARCRVFWAQAWAR